MPLKMKIAEMNLGKMVETDVLVLGASGSVAEEDLSARCLVLS